MGRDIHGQHFVSLMERVHWARQQHADDATALTPGSLMTEEHAIASSLTDGHPELEQVMFYENEIGAVVRALDTDYQLAKPNDEGRRWWTVYFATGGNDTGMWYRAELNENQSLVYAYELKQRLADMELYFSQHGIEYSGV